MRVGAKNFSPLLFEKKGIILPFRKEKNFIFKKHYKKSGKMKEATQKIFKLENLIPEKFIIPNYQRPYKWTEKNVVQLLEDIFEYIIINDKNYRIGNIILHDDGSDKNIVDGQQRLTTISLILKTLDDNFSGLLMKQNYKNTISKNNIVHNFNIISGWIDSKIGNDGKENFRIKILEKCEFVIFTVYEQDEAFQLFDSQNTRGKTLEPYDLLKAFHLREMDSDSEEERAKCVERWENSVDNGTLKPIFENHLFKIRKWSRNQREFYFTKENIDEFKGISLHQKQKYPYETAMRILDGFVENANKDKISQNLQVTPIFPFQITMPIINGKRFFEYVDFYISLKEKLFKENKENPKFADFYDEYCFDYYGSWRSGDEKVRTLYENMVLAFVDKLGYVTDFELFYKAFYKLSYHIRCEKNRIMVETILNSDAQQIFSEINHSITPKDLKKYQYKTYKIENSNFVKGIDEIVKFIKGEKQ